MSSTRYQITSLCRILKPNWPTVDGSLSCAGDKDKCTVKSPGEAPDLRGTMEIQVGLSFITSISHSVNSQVCKDCNGDSGGENKCKKKTNSFYRNVGFERNLEVQEYLLTWLTVTFRIVCQCLFAIYLSYPCFFFPPSVCLNNLSPLYPLCCPFLLW